MSPTCCATIFEDGGFMGDCIDATVARGCVGPSMNCQNSTPYPDGTPCDDGRACTKATPEPPLIFCVGTDGTVTGPDCTRDRPRQDAGVLPNDCPASARLCSGDGAFFGPGQGGDVVNGRCCPDGMACNLATGICRGNLGRGIVTNDVCRSGVCSHDDDSACPDAGP